MKKFFSIKSKLVIISILLVTVPLLVLGYTSYQSSYHSLNELGEKNLQNSVEMTMDMIDDWNALVDDGKMPLEDAQEMVKTMLLGEMDADGSRPINDHIDLGENGYLYVVDQKGVLLAHPNNEGTSLWDSKDNSGNYFIREVIERGNEGGGLAYYDYPLPKDESVIKPKVTYSKTYEDWDWTIAAGTYMMDFNAAANSILKNIALVIAGSLLIGLFIIWYFASRLSRPIQQISTKMHRLAMGDLTQGTAHSKLNDETSILAEAMNHMQSMLKKMIHDIRDAASTITTKSNALSTLSNDVKSSVSQISDTMEEISVGSADQANNATELSSAIDMYKEQIQYANKNGAHMEKATAHILQLSEDGGQLMTSSATQMQKIDQMMLHAVAKMEGLDKQSTEINRLVSVIEDIAEQTNLLALNATIEAARAGEHGRGFTVVADEVRKLAEQVSASIGDITNSVTDIRRETNAVSSVLQAGYEEIKTGTQSISSTSEKFTEINTGIKDMADDIYAITTSLNDMTTETTKIGGTINDVAAVSEETAANIEETSASSVESSAATEEITASIKELADLADHLDEMIQQFNLSTEK